MLPFEISSILQELTIHMLISGIHFFHYGTSSGYQKCNQGFTLGYEHLQRPKSDFPASLKSRKLYPPTATVIDQFRQTWPSLGTGFGCLFHLLFTCPCLSHGIIFGQHVLELADVQGAPTVLYSYKHSMSHPVLGLFWNRFASSSGL